MGLKRKIGEILECEISGIKKKLKRVRGWYDLSDKCQCPICPSLGIPWSGMFHCESGQHKAIIETGQCFTVVR